MRRIMSCLVLTGSICLLGAVAQASPFERGVRAPRAVVKPIPGLAGAYRTVPTGRFRGAFHGGGFGHKGGAKFKHPYGFSPYAGFPYRAGLPYYGDAYYPSYPAASYTPDAYAEPPAIDRGPPATTGIPPGPQGQPTVYVIHSREPAAHAPRHRPRIVHAPRRGSVLQAGDPAVLAAMESGPRIIDISVPKARPRDRYTTRIEDDPQIIYAPR